MFRSFRHVTAAAVLALAAFSVQPAKALDFPSYTIRTTQGNAAWAKAEADVASRTDSFVNGCGGQSLYAKTGYQGGQVVAIAQSPYERDPLLVEACTSGYSDGHTMSVDSKGNVTP